VRRLGRAEGASDVPGARQRITKKRSAVAYLEITFLGIVRAIFAVRHESIDLGLQVLGGRLVEAANERRATKCSDNSAA